MHVIDILISKEIIRSKNEKDYASLYRSRRIQNHHYQLGKKGPSSTTPLEFVHH